MQTDTLHTYSLSFGDKLQGWWVHGTHLLPNLLVALVFLMACILVSRPCNRLVYRLVRYFTKSVSIGHLFGALAQIAVVLLGVYIGLNLLHLDKIAISLLAGAGIVGLTLAFAFQDLTANFISGVYIDFSKPFEVGDIIEAGSIKGEVEHIGLRSTSIHAMDGVHILVPNKILFQGPVINYSRSPKRQISLQFLLAIQDELEEIEKRILESVQSVPGIGHHGPVHCYFTDMDQKNVTVNLHFWIRQVKPYENLQIRHAVILAVLKGLKTNGIKMLNP